MLMKTTATVVLGIILFLIATSCNNALNKSIGEPLTPEEVNEAVKKDPMFSITYKFVERHSNYLKTTSQKAMWYGLTYNRLHKFVMLTLDDEFEETHTKKFADEWELKYGRYEASVDSVCDIWQKYWDTHKAESYVHVDLINIEKEYTQPPWGGEPLVTSREFVMKVTPLRGKVDGVSFDYDLVEKDEEPYFSSWSSHYHSAEISYSFNAPVVVKKHPTLKFEIDEVVKASDFKTVMGKYKFAYTINYVIVNGKKVNLLALIKATPDAVFSYMKEKGNKKGSDFDKKYAFERVVTDILKKEYVSKDTYISTEMQRVYKEIDELAFSFYSL